MGFLGAVGVSRAQDGWGLGATTRGTAGLGLGLLLHRVCLCVSMSVRVGICACRYLCLISEPWALWST